MNLLPDAADAADGGPTLGERSPSVLTPAKSPLMLYDLLRKSLSSQPLTPATCRPKSIFPVKHAPEFQAHMSYHPPASLSRPVV